MLTNRAHHKPEMHHTVRPPSKTKAALAAAGAVAVLLGGGSSFALWSETMNGQGLMVTDTVTAGNWTFSVSSRNGGIMWWDVSGDWASLGHGNLINGSAVAHGNPDDGSWGGSTVAATKTWGSAANATNLGGTGTGTAAAGSVFTTNILGTAGTDNAPFPSSYNGIRTDSATFRMVPGDKLLARFDVDATQAAGLLTGQNLKAEVTGMDGGSSSTTLTKTSPLGAIPLAADVVHTEGSTVWVEIDWPANQPNGGTTGMNRPDPAALPNPIPPSQFTEISIADLDITLTQVR